MSGLELEAGCYSWGFWAGVGTEDGYMWRLGAVEYREAPDCYERGQYKPPRRTG